MGRTDKIIKTLSKSPKPLTHAEIRRAIRAQAEEATSVAATCLRLVVGERISRKKNSDGLYVYKMTQAQKKYA